MDRVRWTYKKLGDVATIINGKNQKAVEDSNGQYPICGSGGIMGYATDYLCPENSVIVGRKGNINRPIFMTQKFWNVDTAFGISANLDLMIPKFLFYFCQIFDFQKLNKAVTIPSLVKSDLLKIEIPVPSKEKQLDIVAELDTLSDTISMLQRQLSDLDILGLSIFHDMFGDPIINDKNWTFKPLCKIFDTASGGTPSKKHPEYFDNGSIPWLRSGEVSQGMIYTTEMFITEEGLQNSSAKYFPVDTVVVAMYGATVGQVGLLKKEMTTNQAVCGIFPNSNFSPIFMLYYIKAQSEFLKRQAVGGAQPNISQDTIKNMNVPIIQQSLQQSFAYKIESIEDTKEAINTQIAEIQRLLAARMQYWFN